MVRMHLAPAWLPRLLLGDEVLLHLCDRVGELDVVAQLVQQWVPDLAEVVAGQQVAQVAQVELQVAQVEQQVVQAEQGVVLEACFDLEQVESPCEKQRPLQGPVS